MRHFNNLKYMAMALFVAMLSLSFTACGDDDDDDGGSRPSIVGSWEQTNSYGTEITVTFNSNKQGSVTYTYYDSNDVPTGNETEFFEYDYNTTDGTLVVIGNTQLEGTWSVNVMSTKLMLSNSSASYVFTKR